MTLFYPDENVIENIRLLSKQTDCVILSDNTPETNNENLFCGIKSCVYIANKENKGLSVAFNTALREHQFNDDDYVVFFDQDSRINERYIECLVRNFEQINFNATIGCIGPQYIDTNSGTVLSPRRIDTLSDYCFTVSSMITSGLMTKYAVLKKIGFWNEEIFLDMADWDICWRMQAQGLKVVLCTEATLIHTLGKGIKKIGLIKLRKNHPVREYYQIRDSIKLFYHAYVPTTYRLRFLFMWFVMPVVYIIFLPKRCQRIRFVSRAFFDGMRGLNGAFSDRKREQLVKS